MSRAFDDAWLVVKAPWFVIDDDYEPFFDDRENIKGPLYSGGHQGDDPRYWTRNFDEALRYALFGSGVGMQTMRQTIPQVMVAEDPGPLDYERSPQNVLFADPETWTGEKGAVMSEPLNPDYDWGVDQAPMNYTPMPEAHLSNHISDMIRLLGEHGIQQNMTDEGLYVRDTSAQNATKEDIMGHLLGALGRLEGNEEPGRLDTGGDDRAGTSRTYRNRQWGLDVW
jgi:hypothetical protein